MAEVSRQLEPTHSLLQQLHEWQLAFWSNGSGRVPGFFQRRMKEDDTWRGEAATKLDTLANHKESVDKFILELRLARDFREKREQEAKERQEKFKERLKFLTIKVALPIVVAILGLIGIAIKQSVPVIKILIDDYLKAHPLASERIKNLSQVYDPTLAQKQGDDAGVPTSFEAEEKIR
jgi:hypothetical protein